MRVQTVLVMLAAVCTLVSAFVVYGQDAGPQVAITAPAEGDLLSGEVIITGSAAHPTQFVAYQLWFALSGTEQWFPITGPLQNPVTQGQLATWNASSLPPGQYRLRLQLFLTDGSLEQVIVENLQIQPVQDAPTEPPDMASPPTAIPILDASPTAADVTRVPLPSSAPTAAAGDVPVELSSEETTPPPASGGVLGAFCAGALISLALFALMGVYRGARGRVRQSIRRFVSGLEDDTRRGEDT